MKKSSVNTFTEGLVCDLDPINVPNNVLTDCLNGTIITYDDNEYSLQNDKGNYPLKDCKLRENFIPVGIKEHNGILYIASLNPITGEEEIGSYPSPKLYDGGTVDGNINIEYVIDKAFEELKVSELDYSELESRCKSWYYADPKLKLNVGDKFWFDEESSSTNFETIEKYIIDENSIPHLISNDLMNKSLEYVSPISGTIMLKNKIFEIANSSAETNTFSCWVNDTNSSEISNSSEDSDTLLNNITSLFSFTHKLYIDDVDTLQWLTNDYLKYKVNLKVNDLIVYSNTFDGNSLISDSKTFGEYEVAIESRHTTNLEWYGNNKIISKYFISVIKNIDSDDQISAEIIPIVSISDTKNIIMSQFTKPLHNSVSEYTSTTWTIGEEYYRFYNHPIDNVYKTQYVELDIKGPIEASDDFLLNYNIYEYNSSNWILSGQFTPGIGKTILQIDYNNSFVKEDIYAVEYSIMLAGTSVKSAKKKLITSELFNYDEFLEYHDYETIPDKEWISKYENTIDWGNNNSTNEIFKSKLHNSKYAWVYGLDDKYLDPNKALFISDLEENYLDYINSSGDYLLDGSIYEYNINIGTPTFLTGNLWNVIIDRYKISDCLSKMTDTLENNINIEIPLGIGMKLNMSPVGTKCIWGNVVSIEEIPVNNYGDLIMVYSEHLSSDNKSTYWEFAISNSTGSGILYEKEIPYQELKKNPVLKEEVINSGIFKNIPELNKVRYSIGGSQLIPEPYPRYRIEGKPSGVKKFYLCQSSEDIFGWLSEGNYFKINSKNIDDTYESGFWYDVSKGSIINLNPEINIKKSIQVSTKVSYTKTFSSDDKLSLSDLKITTNIDDKYDTLSNSTKKEYTNYQTLRDKVVPKAGSFVKGVLKEKEYSDELSENYRLDNVIKTTKGCPEIYLTRYLLEYLYDDYGKPYYTIKTAEGVITIN